MKIRTILIVVAVIALVIFLIRGCDTDDSSPVEQSTTEAREEPAEETREIAPSEEPEPAPAVEPSPAPPLKTTPPEDPEQLMVGIVHSVKDAGGWVNSYYNASDEANRVAIYQNLDEPGHIFVLEHITRERIEEKLAGGSVNVFFKLDHQEEMDDLQQFCIAFYYEVADYDKWASIFNSVEMQALRASYGLEVWATARGYTNPNMIYIMYTTSDLAPIKEAIKINEFKRAYQDARITNDPQLHYLEFIKPPEI